MNDSRSNASSTDKQKSYPRTFNIKLVFSEPLDSTLLVTLLRDLQHSLTTSGFLTYSSLVEKFDCNAVISEKVQEDILRLNFQKKGKYADLIPAFKMELLLVLDKLKIKLSEAGISSDSNIDQDTVWYPL